MCGFSSLTIHFISLLSTDLNPRRRRHGSPSHSRYSIQVSENAANHAYYSLNNYHPVAVMKKVLSDNPHLRGHGRCLAGANLPERRLSDLDQQPETSDKPSSIHSSITAGLRDKPVRRRHSRPARTTTIEASQPRTLTRSHPLFGIIELLGYIFIHLSKADLIASIEVCKTWEGVGSQILGKKHEMPFQGIMTRLGYPRGLSTPVNFSWYDHRAVDDWFWVSMCVRSSFLHAGRLP